MELRALLQARRSEILALAERHGAHNVRVFGSVARGEAGPESDIDLLVTLDVDRSLLDLVALWQDLEDLLGREVDIVTEPSLKERMRAQVLREAVVL
jgi:uncharacterized protein